MARSRGCYDQAIAEFSDAIRTAPLDAEAYLLRGEAFAARGDPAQAMADFSEAVRLDFSRVLNCANRVLLHTSQHHFDEAAADAQGTLQLHRRLARAYFLRGRLHAQQAEPARAVADLTQSIELEPDNGAAFVERGEVYVASGDLGRAIDDFAAALRLEPDTASTWSKRGRAFQQQGEHDRALADFTETLRLAPDCAAAFADRGAVHQDRGEHEQALADYNQAIHLDPRCPRAYLQRSMIHAARCDYERALADFDKALALDPKNYFAHENRDIVRRLKAEYEQSVAEFNRVRSDFQKAVVHFAQAMDMAPRQLAASLPPDQRLTQADRNGPAKEVSLPVSPPHEDDTDLEPESEAPRGSQEVALPHADVEEPLVQPNDRAAEEHCRQAQSLHARGENDRAIQEYTLALRLAPDCVTAYLERGRLYRLRGRFHRALADFTAVLGIDETNAEAYLRRGNAYAGKGQYEAALADYNKAIELAPDHGLTYVNRGLAFAKLGEFERVIEDAGQALRLDPRLSGALFIRGAAYFKQGRAELAIADLDMLLLLEPKHVLAYNERGLVYASRGEYDRAIADYSRALQLDPQFELAHFNRAIASRLQGQPDKAIAEFSDILAHAPENAAVHYQRGLAYFDQKEHDRAIADLTRAFRLDPKCKEAYTSCLEVLRAKHEQQRPSSEASMEEPAPPILPAGDIALQEETPHVEAPADAPETPQRVENPPPIPAERTTADASAETATEVAREVVTVGKLRLECPTCGTMGLLDVRNLKKAFRCPGCSNWWRTDAGGRLVEVTPLSEAGVEVEVWSNTGGRSKHHVPSEEKPAASPKPPPTNKPGSRKKPPPPARLRGSSEGMLHYAGNWVAAASATRGGRWALGVAVVLLVASVGLAVTPLLWPGQLKTRGQTLVHAWLVKDFPKMEQYTEPADKPSLKDWLEKHPPPDLVGQEPPPDVRVSIEGNNGRTAVVVVQIAAKDSKGYPAHYVFRHRWIERGGDWYFHPQEAKGNR